VLRSRHLQLDVPTKVWYYISEDGGPLSLINADSLTKFDEVSRAPDVSGACCCTELMGLSFDRLRDGRVCMGKSRLRADERTKQPIGYLLVPCDRAKRVILSQREVYALTLSDLAGLKLEPATRATAGSSARARRLQGMLLVVWTSGAVDPALSAMRKLLPLGTLIVSLSPEAQAALPEIAERVPLLLSALKSGTLVFVEPVCLQQVTKLAHASSPPVKRTGAAGARSRGDLIRRNLKQLKDMRPEECVQVRTRLAEPPAARGEPQPLRCWLFHPDNQSDMPDATGIWTLKKPKDSGAGEHYRWGAEHAAEAAKHGQCDEEALRAAAEERAETHRRLYNATVRTAIAGDEDMSSSTTSMPKAKGRPNITDDGDASAAQWGGYPSPIPRLSSRNAESNGGDNTQLRFVRNYFKNEAKVRARESEVNALAQDWHRTQAGAFDCSRIVEPAAGTCSGAARGEGSGDAGVGGVGSSGSGAGAASRSGAASSATPAFVDELRAVTHEVSVLKQKLCSLQSSGIDHEMSTGSIPELRALLHRAQARLVEMGRAVHDGVQVKRANARSARAAAAPATAQANGSESEDDSSSDESDSDPSNYQQHAGISNMLEDDSDSDSSDMDASGSNSERDDDEY
jgi:hypothetical protein